MISAKFIRKIEDLDPKLRESFISLLEEVERIVGETVRRQEFLEFVKETRENFKKVWEAINELTEAQRRTEERLNQLTERVNQLAEAQRRTEEELRKLTGEVAILKERVEGISHSVGYTLENASYRALPLLLKRDLGIEIEDRLKRKYFRLGDRMIQINIFGYGHKDGERVMIMGESKVRPSRKELRAFINRVKRMEKQEGIKVIPVVVAHDFPPEIETYLDELGVTYYWSYEFDEV